ncbi:MAG TPA: ADP-ribosylation factor-like protein [Candidatus Deferrimicrobium sp.]|nr:ADP-ribosylation factor-like protein [Candidatus Deferrimicrobium sp.]
MGKTNSIQKTKKILLMGLDNSGKTSIILSLTKNTNLLSFVTLSPTKGLNIVNIDEYNSNFNIWELGGQEQYRKEYLQDLEKYIHDPERIIFVIDSQDAERYEIALDYLRDILEALKQMHKKFEFYIYLHKYDPNLEIQSTFIRRVKEKLIAKLKKVIPSDFNYKIYKTSIYTVFKREIVPED